eukprot:TRINITY_DN16231_c0_g1_i1.p1 TRINITY_DN16231_c0_g1~~TRINITY_DN16231_c0_g1_i1.p1  ORF type:complete len:242 (+),score=69.85 TRINITY_DN16231_c0_g1_i1:59-784(+)
MAAGAQLPHLPKPFQAIIFDIDGTLVDSFRLGFDATAAVLAAHGLPAIDEATYHTCTKYSTPERFGHHAGLAPGTAEFEAAGRRLGAEFDDRYIALVDERTAGFFPGVADMLAAIPDGVLLGAVTNACERYAHAAFRANCPAAQGRAGRALQPRFRAVLGADTAPRPKPHPDGLLACAAALGVPPEACVYVGDSPSDAHAAAAAGMPALGVLWGSHPEATLRDASFTHLCRSVAELQRALL